MGQEKDQFVKKKIISSWRILTGNEEDHEDRADRYEDELVKTTISWS